MSETLQAPSEVGPYLDTVKAYEKASSKWRTQAKKIVKRYLDERSDQQANRLKFNILWANVETLKPAIYAKTPKPEVERRFLDKDPVGRMASEVLERCLDYYLSATPFGSTMRQSRTDYLLVGRGTSWVRYVPQIKQLSPQITDDVAIGDDNEDGEAPEPMEEISWEDVMSDYVHWSDFGHNIARTWEEVNAVWRIVYMTRQQMKRRGFEEWNEVPLDYTDREMKDADGDTGKKAAVFELWDKSERKVFWFTKAHPRFLDVRDDPLGLDRFFPCSQPIYATLANESLIPVPDYIEYQDQATELDEITARISALQKAIKAAGVYDAGQPNIARLLNEGVTNELLPVEGWAALQEKGGLSGAVEMLPMKEIAETLLMLYEAREKVKQDLYEITGMSDIIRGATKATETATAQNIKNSYVTLRLSEKQREMQRFARNTIEIMGNIICRHFQDETIVKVSGVQMLTAEQKQQAQMQQQMAGKPAPLTGQPIPPLDEDVAELLSEPTWEEVLALLRADPDRCFRIDIETDSTIELDAAQDRDEAMAFLTAVGGFLEKAVQVPPSLAPLAGAMLEFGVRKWRVGRQLEGTINKTVEEMEKAAKNPPQQQPDPAMAKVQQDGQMQTAQLQQSGQLKQAEMAASAQTEQAKIASMQKIEQLKLDGMHQIEAGKQALEAERLRSDAQSKAIQAENERQLEEMRISAEDARERDRMAAEQDMERFKAELEARTRIEVAEITAGASLQAAQISAASAAVENKPEKAEETKPDKGHEALASAIQGMTEVVKESRKPRKVIRDGDGKVAGIE